MGGCTHANPNNRSSLPQMPDAPLVCVSDATARNPPSALTTCIYSDCISATVVSVAIAKGVWWLRIFQDQRYRGLIGECVLAMSAVTRSRVNVQQLIGCVEIGASWKPWIHLFPQHGAGPKWLRPTVMEPWQQKLIDAYPGPLIRGLIHSDGCRATNTVSGHGACKQRRYSYPRYMFTNMSDNIRFLFVEACERLNVRWTQTNARTIAVSRRDDVARLDTFIGPKY